VTNHFGYLIDNKISKKITGTNLEKQTDKYKNDENFCRKLLYFSKINKLMSIQTKDGLHVQ